MNVGSIILHVDCPEDRGEIHLHRNFLYVCPCLKEESCPNPTYSPDHDGGKINTSLLKLFFSSCVSRHEKLTTKIIAVQVIALTKHEHMAFKLLELVERRNLETFGKSDCKTLEC